MSEICNEIQNKNIPKVWKNTLSKMMYMQIRTYIESQYLYKNKIKVRLHKGGYNDTRAYVILITENIDSIILRDLERLGYWQHEIKPSKDGKTLRLFVSMEFENFKSRYLDGMYEELEI